VVSFTPHPLYPQGKSPLYPLDRRLGGPQSRSRRGGEEKSDNKGSEMRGYCIAKIFEHKQSQILFFLPLIQCYEKHSKREFAGTSMFSSEIFVEHLAMFLS
jgi:hypothetical protein